MSGLVVSTACARVRKRVESFEFKKKSFSMTYVTHELGLAKTVSESLRRYMIFEKFCLFHRLVHPLSYLALDISQN